MSHDLKHEVARLWNLRKMLVIVVSALGSVTKNVGTWIDQLQIKVSTVFVLQKATLTGSPRILANKRVDKLILRLQQGIVQPPHLLLIPTNYMNYFY